MRTLERSLDFSFDRVFTVSATQAEVYASVRHVVLGVMEGFNGTLLAYGQTSSGKTHTMMGRLDGSRSAEGVDGVGIIPRAVSELFAAVLVAKESLEFRYTHGYV